MSTCELHALTALLFDELPDQDALAVQRHARTCFECSRTLAELRADRDRLRAPRGEAPSFDALFRGVEARIAAPRTVRRPRWELLPGLVPLAGGCLALLLAVFALGGQGPVRAQGPGALDASSLACWVEPGPATEDDGWALAGGTEAALSVCLIQPPGASASRVQACF